MWRAYANSNESIVSLVTSTVRSPRPQSLQDVQPGSKFQDERRKFSYPPAYITTHWRLYSRDYVVSASVVSLQLGFGIWQCYKYSTNEAVKEAFGWGVPVAKFAAGALYPTFVLLILSMSRWLATIGRHTRGQKYLNWDRNRYFHVRMAIMALVLSLLHACGHIMGTIPSAVQTEHRQAVKNVIGSKVQHLDWMSFLLSRLGWTGVLALFIFLIIATSSSPAVRKRSFEAFQLAHLLVFPMLVLLALHGTAALLQYPALGFVLAGPLTIILCEKLVRATQCLGYRMARIAATGKDCVEVKIFTSGSRRLFYHPGQYILLRIPRISRFQWHPFTVVRTDNSELVVIAKNNGDWTRHLQTQPEVTTVNLDGPFGAPCQGFWDYENSILIGMGMGLTSSAAILNELLFNPTIPWTTNKRYPEKARSVDNTHKRVSVVWVVRDATLLNAFTPLLKAMLCRPRNNEIDLSCHIYISGSAAPLHPEGTPSTTPSVPFDWTGSIIQLDVGKRPNFSDILQEHHCKLATNLRENILRTGQPRMERSKIGVFFCGTKTVKSELRQICFERTRQGVMDGSDLEYHFHPEVF